MSLHAVVELTMIFVIVFAVLGGMFAFLYVMNKIARKYGPTVAVIFIITFIIAAAYTVAYIWG